MLSICPKYINQHLRCFRYSRDGDIRPVDSAREAFLSGETSWRNLMAKPRLFGEKTFEEAVDGEEASDPLQSEKFCGRRKSGRIVASGHRSIDLSIYRMSCHNGRRDGKTDDLCFSKTQLLYHG